MSCYLISFVNTSYRQFVDGKYLKKETILLYATQIVRKWLEKQLNAKWYFYGFNALLSTQL